MLSKKIKDSFQSAAHKMGYHVLSKNRISGDLELFLKGVLKRGLKVNHVLDVGAHTGDWSSFVAQLIPEASFYLIEPQEELKPEIDRFLQNHKGKLFIGGAGSEVGELSFTVFDDKAGSSFLPTGDAVGTKKQKKVPVFSIDSLVEKKEIAVPDLCKIDVQGYELEVLKGAKSILGKTDVFIIETNLFKFFPNQPLAHEIIAFMSENGYLIYDFAGFLNRPLDGALGQVDVCFVKQDSILYQNNLWE